MATDVIHRRSLVNRGIRLEYVTVGWNIVEGVVAILSGYAAGSVALIGFGVDSAIESGSGGILLWRLYAEQQGKYAETLEKRSLRHWDAVLPGQVLRVCYEDVVKDLEQNVRRILEFCGLQFEPACVDFQKLKRSVGTASSEQVRQPIFREGLVQWKNYEPWLDPLK